MSYENLIKMIKASMELNEDIKKQIIKDIKSRKYAFNFTIPPNLDIEEIAIEFVVYDIDNIKHVNSFYGNKEFFINMINKGLLKTLSYMDKSLKKDMDFALLADELNPSSIEYFDESIKYSEFFVNKALSDLNSYFFLAGYLREKTPDLYYQKLNEQFKAYRKLHYTLQRDENAIIAVYSNPKSSQYDVDYIGLTEDLKDNLKIATLFLNKISSGQIYYNNIVSKLKNYIKNDENLKYFQDNFTGKYSFYLMKTLCANKSFKNSFSNILKNEPNLQDYNHYIREIKMAESLTEKDIKVRKKI